MNRKIAAALTVTAIVIAGIAAAFMFGSHRTSDPMAARPAAVTSAAASDQSCQIATAAKLHATALIGIMTVATSSSSLAKVGAIYSIAAEKISNSGVPLLNTRAGRLAADLSGAALYADRLVVDIRMSVGGDFRKSSAQLLAAEAKITNECINA
jgi:hypothetical protein